MPSRDLLDELLRQVLTAKKDATIKIQIAKNYEIRRYQDEIYIVPKNKNIQQKYEMIWAGESEIILPNGQKLTFKKVKGRGINLKFLDDKAGFKIFYYTLPQPYNKLISVYCPEWDHTYNFYDNNDISVKFIEFKAPSEPVAYFNTDIQFLS